MLDSVDELRPLLGGTALEGLAFERFEVPDTSGSVIAAELKGIDHDAAWDVARALLDRTGRWPLLIELEFSGGSNFEESLLEVPFSRFPFEDANGNVASPQSIISASSNVDIDAVFAQRARDIDEDDDVEWLYEDIESEVGRRPPDDELDPAIAPKAHQLDRWVYDRQLADGSAADASAGRQQLWKPQQPALVLMPTDSGWETLAWASWFGAETSETAAAAIAIGKRWQQEFGAELYGHYMTMLECRVANPPAEPDKAWSLAAQHDLFAPCTLALPGISVRDYAQALIGWDRWFLHERP